MRGGGPLGAGGVPDPDGVHDRDRDFACLPVTDPGATLLTCGTPRIVDTVLVGGDVVVTDGRSTRIDVDALTVALLALDPDLSR